MLLLVTGASGAGKSIALAALQSSLAGQPVKCVEFDSVGVPPGADTAWRHGVVDQWVREAIADQQAGRHMVLCGQVPVGELLAAPSAAELDAIAVLHLHCSPEVRRRRLIGRGGDGDLKLIEDHLAFGEWCLHHTLDSTHTPHVIRVESPVRMRWERWDDWSAGDPRWAFDILDTDACSRQEAAERVVSWARDVLAGRRPALTRGWATRATLRPAQGTNRRKSDSCS